MDRTVVVFKGLSEGNVIDEEIKSGKVHRQKNIIMPQLPFGRVSVAVLFSM